MKYITFLVFLGFFSHLSASQNAFKDYWYDGAEISHYELEQARYGSMHEGSCVLIYVTEKFLSDKQVKFEGGPGDKAVPILKLNAVRKFVTGIYDYSMMSSVFAPLGGDHYQHALKVNTTSQEWCGQTFTQFNRRDNHIHLKLYSYFQSESDQEKQLPAGWLEDEIWTAIRIAPEKLPLGDFEIIPSGIYQRLSHVEIKPQPAEAKIYKKGDSTFYDLRYKETPRHLVIEFETDFPHQIQGWRETNGTKDKKGKLLETTAELVDSIKSYYWEQNQPKHTDLRDELDLN